jgi:hypothetical protein
MTQKFVEVSSATATDRLAGVENAMCHLSDGTCVYLLTNGGTTWTLEHSGADHATPTTIITLGSPFAFNSNIGSIITVLCDSLDNLYVLGRSTTNANLTVQAFTKGSGYTWTAQTALSQARGVGGANPISAISGVWCNTGGGTGSKGHIVLVMTTAATNVSYVVGDAGVALAGTGTFKVTGGSPIFISSTPVGTGVCPDLSPDGFGATSGLGIGDGSSTTTPTIGAWGINSSGVLTTNTNIGSLTTGIQNNAGKLRLHRYGSNGWAAFVRSTTSTRYMIARYSATAQLTAPVDSGIPTHFIGNGGTAAYDSFLDPVTATKVWVIEDPAGSAQHYRLGCSVGSGVVWDAAMVADDSISNNIGSGGSIRAVKEPRGTPVDWQAFVQTAASNYALDGDYSSFFTAPNAPTLTAPSSGSYVDVSGGVIFTGTYNSTDGQSQNFYALRQKIGAGAYSYWRASDSTWQSTIQWNAITTAPGASFSISTTGLTNGNTYAFSIASEEVGANFQGPFATDQTFFAAVGPTVVVNTPSGTITSSSSLTTWTPTVVGAEIVWRVVIYSAVQYGAGGFVPGSGPNVWDSGVISNANTSVMTGTVLLNGIAYRAYMQITQTGGQTSVWAFSGFTVVFNSPAQPLLTGSYDSVNARSILNVQAFDNLLSQNQASLETDTTGWAATANCAIAQSATFAKDGSFSLRMTSTAAGDMVANTPTNTSGVAVLPNTVYTAMANFRSAVSVRSCLVQIDWYQASGAPSAIRSTDNSATVNDATGAWQSGMGVSLTVTSPSDAAFAAIVIYALAIGGASEVHYVDCIGIGPGTLTQWTRGGLVGSSTALIESSDDGVTWKTVRGANAVAVPSPSETVIAYDYEVLPLQVRNYRATIQSSGPISSGPSALLPLTSTGKVWWLKDPLNPANNVKLSLPSKTEPQSAVAEQIASFRPLGRSTVVVLADAVTKVPRMGGFTCQTLTQANYLLLLQIISLQKTLLLQDAYGEQFYVRLIGRSITGPRGGRIREFQLTYYEVDIP